MVTSGWRRTTHYSCLFIQEHALLSWHFSLSFYMWQLWGNKQQNLTLHAIIEQFARAGGVVRKAIGFKFDNAMSFFQTIFHNSLFMFWDKRRNNGIIATRLLYTSILMVSAFFILPEWMHMALKTGQSQQNKVTNSIIVVLSYPYVAHWDKPFFEMFFHPFPSRVVVHIIYHVTKLASMFENGFIKIGFNRQ